MKAKPQQQQQKQNENQLKKQHKWNHVKWNVITKNKKKTIEIQGNIIKKNYLFSIDIDQEKSKQEKWMKNDNCQ